VLPRCRGRYVALLNPDTVVPTGTFPALLAHLDAHPSVGAAGPTLKLPDGRIQPECARHLPRVGNLFSWLLLLDKLEWGLRFRERAAPDGDHPPRGTLLDRFTLLSWSRSRTCEVESICGACKVISREVVEQVGPLEETQAMYLEDIDYCRRIRDAGWAIHYVAEASIHHRWQHSTSARRRDGDFYALGCHAIWLYLRKHEGRAAAAAYGAMAATAAPLRILTALLGLGLSLVLRARGVAAFWRRHLQMAWGLGRWAWRWPRAAPDLGIGPSGGRPASGGPRSSERTRGR
jgi:GT2 family glycosyltransferase